MTSGGRILGVGSEDLRETFTPLPAPRHPDAQKLKTFWEARPADGIVVGRDVPSRAISHLLSHVVVWEPFENGSDMRVRLAGAALARRFPDNLKGRTMSELFPNDFRSHLSESDQVFEKGTPLFLESRVSCGKIEVLHLEIALLPVRSPDGKRPWLLTGVFFFD